MNREGEIDMTERVLAVSAGLIHPNCAARGRLRRIIEGIPDIQAAWTGDVADLAALDGGGYDGVILYFQRKTIDDETLDALDRFVTGGGGLLAIHSASASFKEVPRYFDILGGRFVTHGKIEPFTVRRTDKAAPFFSVTDPFTVTDELYIHRYDNDVTVHYAAEAPNGPEPVVWTKEYGKGRICYLSLGHRAGIYREEAVRRIIVEGLLWTLGRERGRVS
ncbi:MAG: ThuA domain-containing protein [Deltaproteobacteria bacterium]|nr:ThuA domain-containing protein [Candidatus Zymogenaceae bacterium]